uniref:UDP-glucose 6-dehydrogenase n=1 Tax=Nelumbo nucifera TaxID=4432 RepID=A0A822ZQA0_NELNU|nr:TPA_asm: hypothetical protein HUJ06_016970 [Nelumbo nucifera]
MVKIYCIGAGHIEGPTMALPIYELDLEDMVKQCRGRKLFFSIDIEQHVSEAYIIFFFVNTTTKTRGLGAGKAADLTYWESVARVIADVVKSNKIVVEKSTVPVKTAEAIEKILTHNSKGINFQVLSNPEFLAEGTAIQDLLKPNRVLIGGRETAEGRKAIQVLKDSVMNAFLAQRVSSVNAMSALREATGADVPQVSHAVGKDTRIGPKFLNANVGFGGSCFHKDILNLKQVIEINDYQKNRSVNRVVSSMFNIVSGKKIAILGLALKGTGDTRETPAIDVCKGLLGDKAHLSIYDPLHLQPTSPTSVKQVSDTHGVCILTERDEFKTLAFMLDGQSIANVDRLGEMGFYQLFDWQTPRSMALGQFAMVQEKHEQGYRLIALAFSI